MTIRMQAFVAAFLAIGFLAPPRASAEEAASTTSGEATVGVVGQDRDPVNSAKFLEYRDVPSGFVAEQLFLSWAPRTSSFFDVKAFDVGQRDQRIDVTFGKTDTWKGVISWMENPRLWTDRARQLYAGQGNGVFTLDDTLQSAVQAGAASVDTTPMDGEWDAGTKGAILKSAILNSAQDVSVGWQRKTGGADFTFTPGRSWTFGVGASRERRGGTIPQPLGMYFTLSPSEVAAPVDFTTNWETGRVEYDHKRFNIGAQVTASQFDSGYKSVTWDNQLFLNDTATANPLVANPARGRLTFQTDNRMVQGTVYGGVNMPGHTRLDLNLSRTRTTQDDSFLPTTTNTLLAPAALPAASFDGRYDLDLTSVRVSSRPTKSFRWNAWARRFEYKNDSPSLSFDDYVMTDYQINTCANVNSCGALSNHIARRNLPVGYEKTNLGVSAGLRPVSWLDGSLAVEREEMKRDFSAVTDSHENSAKLALDFTLTDWLSVRSTFRRQERRTDEYDAEYFVESFPIGETYVAPVNEGMRRFIWTDRDRDSASLLAEFTVGSKVSIYAEATYARDLYLDPDSGDRIGESFTISEDRDFNSVPETYDILLAGRTDDNYRTYTLGFSVAPAPRLDLYADYTWEKSTYGLETRYRAPSAGIGSDDPLNNWGSDTDDRYRTANVGFDLDITGKGRWKLSANGSRSVGTGNIDTHFVPGGAASSDTTLTHFPELKTTLTIATATLTHAINRNLDYSLRYWYESWKEDNFASDRMQPYMGDPGNDPGSVTSIFLGMDFSDYTNHLVSFFLRYRF